MFCRTSPRSWVVDRGTSRVEGKLGCREVEPHGKTWQQWRTTNTPTLPHPLFNHQSCPSPNHHSNPSLDHHSDPSLDHHSDPSLDHRPSMMDTMLGMGGKGDHHF